MAKPMNIGLDQASAVPDPLNHVIEIVAADLAAEGVDEQRPAPAQSSIGRDNPAVLAPGVPPARVSLAHRARPTYCHPRVSPIQCATPHRLRTLL